MPRPVVVETLSRSLREPLVVLILVVSCGLASCSQREANVAKSLGAPIVLVSGESLLVEPDLAMRVAVSNHVGGEVSILWLNESNRIMALDVEAPLAVPANTARRARDEGPVACALPNEPWLEGRFAPSWNVAHIEIPPGGWDHSYLAGFVRQDRGCLVALRVKTSGDEKPARVVIVEAVTAHARIADAANESNLSGEVEVSVRTRRWSEFGTRNEIARIDALVRNGSGREVHASPRLERVVCDSGWQVKSQAGDWIVELTSRKSTRSVASGSWAVFSFVFAGPTSGSIDLGCDVSIVFEITDAGRQEEHLKRVRVRI